MFFATPQQTNEQALEKVAVAAVALTLFYFCNPSNVLSPIYIEKFIMAEANCAPRVGFENIHPPSQKTQKWKTSLFHWFCEHSGPTLANRSQIGRRIVHPIEDRLKSLAATAGKVGGRL